MPGEACRRVRRLAVPAADGGQGLQETLSVQVDRCMGTIESLENSLLKYIYLKTIYAQNAPPVLRG